MSNLGFDVGDKIVVKEGTEDPDFGTIIEGWAGEITEVDKDSESQITYRIEWDRKTITRMSKKHIDTCDKENLDHTCMYLFGNEIVLQTVNHDANKTNFWGLVKKLISRGE